MEEKTHGTCANNWCNEECLEHGGEIDSDTEACSRYEEKDSNE